MIFNVTLPVFVEGSSLLIVNKIVQVREIRDNFEIKALLYHQPGLFNIYDQRFSIQ
ncbi:MAG: hypothetical protein WCL02_02610 [bacterium]